MTPQSLTTEQEDEIKLLLLDDNEEGQTRAMNLLYTAFGESILRYIEHHHSGLDLSGQEDALLKTIERFVHVFRGDPSLIDRSLLPSLLRTAFHVGREAYRKFSRRQEIEQGELLAAVADTLKNTELGHTWSNVVDSSFRQRVTDKIREVAGTLKPRQRQVAQMYAEMWGREFSEKDAIDEIYRTSGERLTRDSFKRAYDEVRQKLREPLLKLLIEEGVCPKTLIPKK